MLSQTIFCFCLLQNISLPPNFTNICEYALLWSMLEPITSLYMFLSIITSSQCFAYFKIVFSFKFPQPLLQPCYKYLFWQHCIYVYQLNLLLSCLKTNHQFMLFYMSNSNTTSAYYRSAGTDAGHATAWEPARLGDIWPRVCDASGSGRHKLPTACVRGKTSFGITSIRRR